MKKFKKGTPEAKTHMEQLRAMRNYNKMKGHEELIINRTAEIGVPKKMLYINPNGEQKIINTLTKRGNLTSREHKPVINLVNQDKNYISILKDGQRKSNFKTMLNREKYHEKKKMGIVDASLNTWDIFDKYKRLTEIMNKKSKLTKKNIDEIKYIKDTILKLAPYTIKGLEKQYLYADEGYPRENFKSYLDKIRNIYDEVKKSQ